MHQIACETKGFILAKVVHEDLLVPVLMYGCEKDLELRLYRKEKCRGLMGIEDILLLGLKGSVK